MVWVSVAKAAAGASSAADSVRAGSQASSRRSLIVDLLLWLADAGEPPGRLCARVTATPWGLTGPYACFACLGTSFAGTRAAGASLLVSGPRATRGAASLQQHKPVGAVRPAVCSRAGASLGLRGDLLEARSAPGDGCWDAVGLAGLAVGDVGRVGWAGAGRRACVGRWAGWPTLRWCPLVPWAWSLLHRVTSILVVSGTEPSSAAAAPSVPALLRSMTSSSLCWCRRAVAARVDRRAFNGRALSFKARSLGMAC
jgi:hypothetical protein